LPIKPIADYKKVGLKLAEEVVNSNNDADKKAGNNDQTPLGLENGEAS